ncbi:MAG: aminotransferase class IV [Planctomycetes bacterium]|nr:aminotransferase class IV [Planctomycetota bacterium]
MSARGVWLGSANGAGELVEAASVPCDDPSFTRGEGLFETLRGVRGDAAGAGRITMPLWARHLARLRDAARRAGLPAPDEALLGALRAAAAQVPGAVLRLRLTLTESHAVATAEPLAAGADAVVGIALVGARRDPRDPTAAVKTTSRMFWRLAAREAHTRGGDEPLVLATHGGVAETATANVLLLPAGSDAWVTPAADGSLLPGVGRAALWAGGLALGERRIEPAELIAPGAVVALVNALRGPRLAAVVGTAPPARADAALAGLRAAFEAGLEAGERS